MIIKDVVSLAKYSELAGTAIKEDTDAIVAFINLGMLELYKRFPIKVEEHIVTLVDGTMYYEMPTNFMYALEAYGEVVEGSTESSMPIPINESDYDNSIFFIDWNTVQVPSSVTGSFISIMYVPTPATITTIQAVDDVTQLDIPTSLVDALLSYVGYRAYLGIRSDSQSENNAHWTRFERNCKKAIELGVAYPSESMSMSGRVVTKGFV